jgi:hypothetical protein
MSLSNSTGWISARFPRRVLGAAAVLLGCAALWAAVPPPAEPPDADDADADAEEVVTPPAAPAKPGAVRCANLIYGDNKSSVCFSSEFMSQIMRDSHIQTDPRLAAIRMESAEIYQFPFAVMTGEGEFTLTQPQREALRNYLSNGGFLVASAGCSSGPWSSSFLSEIAIVFPELKLTKLAQSHPIFHTVYDVDRLDCKKSSGQAHLEGLEIDGKIVLIFSRDGLNDTAKAGGQCCCCGGNEIANSRQVNVNLLAYALTH